MLRLTIKNYRCFSDQYPAVFEYRRGFTALVGPNNSGKSALLRLIYEHQPLWQHLHNAGWLSAVSRNPQESGFGARGVVDAQEIICDFTKRPVEINAEWTTAPQATPHVK